MVKEIAGFLVAFFLMAPIASPADPLPKGVIKEGSLTNQKLMSDAMVSVVSKVATKGCSAPETFVPYVVRMPEGPVGERAWAEKWVVIGCGREFPVEIEFREDGMQAATWLVR